MATTRKKPESKKRKRLIKSSATADKKAARAKALNDPDTFINARKHFEIDLLVGEIRENKFMIDRARGKLKGLDTDEKATKATAKKARKAISKGIKAPGKTSKTKSHSPKGKPKKITKKKK